MQTGSRNRGAARRLTLSACLLGMAMMISFAESTMPQLIPLPGFKPGFANIAVMAAFLLSPAYAAAVQAGRVLLTALLFGTPVSFLMSAMGALLSYVVLLVLTRLRPSMSHIGVSVLSAAAHNGGQLIGAMLLTGSTAALSYSVFLGISSTVCGAVCGVLMNLVSPTLIKYIDGKR